MLVEALNPDPLTEVIRFVSAPLPGRDWMNLSLRVASTDGDWAKVAPIIINSAVNLVWFMFIISL